MICSALFLAAAVKVACIGDSITYGYGLNNREETCYPHQLQLILGDKYEVRNFGNSGRGIYLDSMRGKEKRGYRWMKEHKAALDWKPDIVICNLGINDNGEYIKEHTGGRKRGQFAQDYKALLDDYKQVNPKVKFFIWTKLSPLAEGQKFYRSTEPFLMQIDLEAVAKKVGATGIDMQAPLRFEMDSIFAKDKIHPNAAGARIIAETTAKYLKGELGRDGDFSPRVPSNAERWLIAGQSNMQKGWNELQSQIAKTELAQLKNLNIYFWDFNEPDKLTKLTPENAGKKSAFGVSFAIRRAQKIRKPIVLYYVAAGGAPTEAFLSEPTMCKYPTLTKIATNRHLPHQNMDFPCVWCRNVYWARHNDLSEAYWWPSSQMYDRGIKLAKRFGYDGILWYQGESNATKNVSPDAPLDGAYIEETLRAIVDELRGNKKIPFVMMGLPKMNRPWEPYRALQKKVCADTGAIYVDTFAAGLGEPNDVHPRDKRPFAELANASLVR